MAQAKVQEGVLRMKPTKHPENGFLRRALVLLQVPALAYPQIHLQQDGDVITIHVFGLRHHNIWSLKHHFPEFLRNLVSSNN